LILSVLLMGYGSNRFAFASLGVKEIIRPHNPALRSPGRVPAMSGIVTPGQTISAAIAPAMTPLALGFDAGNSTLYALGRNASNQNIFGSIDVVSGAFTQIPPGQTLPGSCCFGAIQLTIQASNPIAGHDGLALVNRSDGTVQVDLSTGQISKGPEPAQTPDALGFDSLTSSLYAKVSGGIDALVPASGVEFPITAYNYARFSPAIVSAVDPYKHAFYVEGLAGSTAMLIAISEAKGSATTMRLATPLVALGFDVAAGRGKNSVPALYGITDGAHNNVLVLVNPQTGTEKPIAALGGSLLSFPASDEDAVDPQDVDAATSSGTTLVSADVVADRSWYVDPEV